jgi:very-short-patch-repair endonuclease
MATSAAVLRTTALRVLHEQGGVAHLQRFLAAGMTRNDVAHLLHLGALQRPRIGWYSTPDLDPAAVRAIRVGGVLGCVSAAESWGIATPPRGTDVVHVSLAPDATRLRRSDDAARRVHAGGDKRVHWHWERRNDPPQGFRVSPVDALLQMAGCGVSAAWLTAAIDSARCATYHEPALDDAATARLRALLPWHLRSTVDRSDPRAESPGETFIRLGVEDAGIPFDLQVWLTEIYRADILIDGWLPVESDGMTVHGTPTAVGRDRERDATLTWLGAPPLRFTQRQSEQELPFVVDTIRRIWTARRNGR